MPAKKPRPDSNARLKRRKTGPLVHYIYFRLPLTLKSAIEQAAKHESIIRGHTVSLNEWVTRACIDRIGEVFGAPTARQFYRQYFNGFAIIDDDIPLPVPNDVTPLLTYK